MTTTEAFGPRALNSFFNPYLLPLSLQGEGKKGRRFAGWQVAKPFTIWSNGGQEMMGKIIVNGKKIVALGILTLLFPFLSAIAYAHGGHASGLRRFKGWWDIIRLKYWGAIIWVLLAALACLIILFVFQQIKAKGRGQDSPTPAA